MPVNIGLAHTSDRLLFLAVVLYALAMLGYAAEFAFGRSGRDAAEAEVSQAAEAVAVEAARSAQTDSRLLVGAGAPTLVPAPVGPQLTPPPVAPTGPILGDGRVLDLSAPRSRHLSLRISRSNGGGSGTTSTSAAAGRIALVLTIVGWLAHIGAVVTRGFAAHRVPWGNMYEFSMMITLIAVTAYLLLLLRQPVRYLGAFVMVPVVCYLGIAGTVLYVPAGPLVPALDSYWIMIHVVAVMSATGIFAVGAVTTALFLIRDRFDTVTAAGRVPGPVASIGRLLPDAKTLDTNAYRINAFAFPVWTFGIICGAIWAESAWGRYWGWDPKETWSFITWVVYAAYLHARATGGWKGKRAAYIAILGFACLTFDFYVVNLIFSGLHSYQGPGL